MLTVTLIQFSMIIIKWHLYIGMARKKSEKRLRKNNTKKENEINVLWCILFINSLILYICVCVCVYIYVKGFDFKENEYCH